jgi:hypothetical protein
MPIKQEFINDYIVNRARKDVEEGQFSNKYSILKGRGLLKGKIGEQIFWNKHPDAVRTDNFDNDFVLGKYTVDVKCLGCTSKPREEYEVNVSTYYKQKSDVYIFYRVLEDLSKAWSVGWIWSKDFWNKCTIKKKGDVRFTTNNGRSFRYLSDSGIMLIKDLNMLKR